MSDFQCRFVRGKEVIQFLVQRRLIAFDREQLIPAAGDDPLNVPAANRKKTL